MTCEFISPILKGDAGLANLKAMIAFINSIGGKVNDSCGCHITVGVRSVIGPVNPSRTAAFVQKLAHIGHHNAWAIYGQTGAGRHSNSYSHQLRRATEGSRKGFSQVQAAEALGLDSVRTLQNWEIARTRPTELLASVLLKQFARPR